MIDMENLIGQMVHVVVSKGGKSATKFLKVCKVKARSVLFIEVDGYVENVDGKGRYMMIDLERGSYTSVHETLDDAVENLTSDDEGVYDFSDSWDQFKSQHNDRLVSVLDYNDVNFQEIENILLDYNINVENIWGLIR